MKTDAYRDLQILEEIAQRPDISQRTLAGRLGIAVGLANLLLRSMAAKGYIKIAGIEKKRLRYLLTPEGIAEKARLTYEYFDASLYLYKKVRRTLRDSMSRLHDEGADAAVIDGRGDLAEVAYLTMREMGLTPVAVVDEPAGGQFFGCPVVDEAALAGLTFDYVIVTSISGTDVRVRRLVAAGVSEKKILIIERHGPHIRAIPVAAAS